MLLIPTTRSAIFHEIFFLMQQLNSIQWHEFSFLRKILRDEGRSMGPSLSELAMRWQKPQFRAGPRKALRGSVYWGRASPFCFPVSLFPWSTFSLAVNDLVPWNLWDFFHIRELLAVTFDLSVAAHTTLSRSCSVGCCDISGHRAQLVGITLSSHVYTILVFAPFKRNNKNISFRRAPSLDVSGACTPG